MGGLRAARGGYPLRVVPVLARGPLPPGGLIPYRQGSRWGYADTTGRVVIAPVLLAEPKFFIESWALANLPDMPLLTGKQGAGTPAHFKLNKRKLGNSYGYLNARGELLII